MEGSIYGNGHKPDGSQRTREILVDLYPPGLLAIFFGIVAWSWPGLTITVLIWLTGIWLVVDGILAIIATIAHRKLLDHI